MGDFVDGMLTAVVLLNFFALGTSRMRAVIRAMALQGALLSVLPVVMHGFSAAHLVLVAIGTLIVKAIVIPALLLRAIRDVTIRREIEPIIGFTPSLLLGAIGTALAWGFSDSMPLIAIHAGTLVVAASFATVFAGFLILTTRQKAVMQIVGYMILENGIFLFGLLLLDALPLLVELGVLLDLLVGVFVMGIILHRIQRTFSSISTSRLASLRE